MTSVTVVFVVVYFSLRFTEALSFAALTAALSFGPSERLTLILRSRSLIAAGLTALRPVLVAGAGATPATDSIWLALGAGCAVSVDTGLATRAPPLGYSAALSTSRSSCSFQERKNGSNPISTAWPVP